MDNSSSDSAPNGHGLDMNKEYLVDRNPSAPDISRDMATEAIEGVRTLASVTITSELFERLYLQPQNAVKGDLRKTFGNPTPLALVGFVVDLTPLACQLLGWRGSRGLETATIGAYYFIGGPCMWVGGMLEFVLGNTFSFVIFFFYGGILFAWAATLHPFYNSGGAYAADGVYRSGLQEDSFWASLAFLPLAAGMVSLVFLVGADRINAVFMMVFFSIGLGFLLIAGAFWERALDDLVLYDRLLQGGGGCWFVTSLCGWYLLPIQVVDSVGFKWGLPVGDLTKFWARREGNVVVVQKSVEEV